MAKNNADAEQFFSLYVSGADAARILGISKARMMVLVREGRVPSYRASNNRVWILREDLNKPEVRVRIGGWHGRKENRQKIIDQAKKTRKVHYDGSVDVNGVPSEPPGHEPHFSPMENKALRDILDRTPDPNHKA